MVLSNCSDHDAACRLLTPILAQSGLPASAAPAYPAGLEFSPGAELACEEPAGEDLDSEVLLVWRAVPWSHPDSYVFFVLKWLLGQASDFMEGGPGRGMHCRAVYLISSEPGIVEIETVFKLFRSTGVFGLAYKVDPERTAHLAASMLYQIASLAETVTEEEVTRAKNSQALKAAINLERKLERSVEQSYNLLVAETHQHHGSIQTHEYIRHIEQVSLADVKRVVEQMLMHPFALKVVDRSGRDHRTVAEDINKHFDKYFHLKPFK